MPFDGAGVVECDLLRHGVKSGCFSEQDRSISEFHVISVLDVLMHGFKARTNWIFSWAYIKTK